MATMNTTIDITGKTQPALSYMKWTRRRGLLLVVAGRPGKEQKRIAKDQDLETGLYFYNARYYDARLARFTQPDTIVPGAFDPQTLWARRPASWLIDASYPL